MNTQQRIDRAKKPVYGKSYETGTPQVVDHKYEFTESELNALLLAVQDEQKEICASQLTKQSYNFTKNQKSNKEQVISAPYAYNPNKEIA